MINRRTDWPAWDVLFTLTMAHIENLPESLSQNDIDNIFAVLPGDYQDVDCDYARECLSKLAVTNLLRFLPVIAPYDYSILFKNDNAVLTLRHRNRLSIIFHNDGMCSVSAEDRVGHAYLYAGSSKKFPLDDDLSWRVSLEESVLRSLGKGFL